GADAAPGDFQAGQVGQGGRLGEYPRAVGADRVVGEVEPGQAGEGGPEAAADEQLQRERADPIARQPERVQRGAGERADRIDVVEAVGTQVEDGEVRRRGGGQGAQGRLREARRVQSEVAHG